MDTDVVGFGSAHAMADFLFDNIGVTTVFGGVVFNATALDAGTYQYELWVGARPPAQ